MKILFKFCVFAVFSCMLTCFIEQSNATTCNGATLATCEKISGNCVWANNKCTAPANGACWGKTQTTCGVTASGSNSYWCHWTYNNGVSGAQSCMTSPPAANTTLACGKGGNFCNSGKKCVLQTNNAQACASGYAGYPACLSNSLSACK